MSPPCAPRCRASRWIPCSGRSKSAPADHQTSRPILMNQIVKGPDGKATYEIKQVFPGSEVMPPVDPACKM